jgi:xanthine dehydrogenase YagS FAD-binding subunit
VNPFAYVRARDMQTALAVNARTPGARYVAGGTNILDLMKDDVERPALLVDINGIGYDRIDARDDGIFIGALVRMTDVARHPAIRERFAAVAMALDETASPQLRNMGTVGGNLLQRTRCTYFRDTAMPCNKRRPGSGCSAIGGENRSLAILGTSERCIATHASDLAVALVAFDAVVHLTSGGSSRSVPIRALYRRPQETPQIENVLEPAELITGVTLPARAPEWRSTYLKVRDRAQYEFALASAAVAVRLESGTIQAADIALGGVATMPWYAVDAARALAGARPAREAFAQAARLAVAGARGDGQNDFKIVLAQRTLIRALEAATA